jgi:DNA-binding NarL/FixJ family response regulator
VTKVLVADDHTLFRKGLALVLQNIFEDLEVMEAIDAHEALALIGDHPDLDLALLDLSMPGMENLQGLSTITSSTGKTPVAILSAHQDAKSIRTTIKLGARGYLLKSFSEDSLRHALALIMAGEIFVPSSVLAAGFDDVRDPVFPSDNSKGRNPLQNLTRRQREVLNHIMEGKSNKVIARELGLYESTVKAHIQVILEKLQADNRTHAAMIAAQWLENTEIQEN